MTKEITKSIILQEIEDKFALREFDSAKFLFSETVIPNYDVGHHLIKPEVKRSTKTITSAAYNTFFTVPDTERWFLDRYNVIFMTGVFTISGVMVTRPLVATDYIYLDLAAAISASYVYNLPQPVIIEPGEDIGINVDGWTSIGDLMLRIGVRVEEIR